MKQNFMLLGDTASKLLCCLIMKQYCQFSDGHWEFCGHPGRALHFYGLMEIQNSNNRARQKCKEGRDGICFQVWMQPVLDTWRRVVFSNWEYWWFCLLSFVCFHHILPKVLKIVTSKCQFLTHTTFVLKKE